MIPKLFVSKNQRRAVFNGKRCRFVPYRRNRHGQLVPPRSPVKDNFCTLCACFELSICCRIIGGGFRDRQTLCGVVQRKDETYGYWKEIK